MRLGADDGLVVQVVAVRPRAVPVDAGRFDVLHYRAEVAGGRLDMAAPRGDVVLRCALPRPPQSAPAVA